MIKLLSKNLLERRKMSGKFEGLTDEQWEILELLFPKIKKKRGCAHKHTPWRKVLNTILWVLITGARWCDVPIGENFGSRSTSHRWLGKWQEDGTWDKALEIILKDANLAEMLSLERLVADGFFSAGKGGGELVDYGYKGKGVTTHLLVEGNGSPISFAVTAANGDERQQVEKLLVAIENTLYQRYKINGLIPIFEKDMMQKSLETNFLEKRSFLLFLTGK